MANYLKKFELTAQYEEYINSDMALLPNVSLIKEINGVNYNPIVPEGPNYLKFTAEEDNSFIRLEATYNYNTGQGPSYSPKIEYSLNGGEWTQWNYSMINLNMGDTVRMKGNNSNGFNNNDDYYYYFITNGKIGASGNIMSLLYEDDFEGKLTIPCNYCFYKMFYNCRSLTTAPELPAMTLTKGCYQYMFNICKALTTAPELPATTLVESCYSFMFDYCEALTKTPELPATTLAKYCYNNMFRYCTSLETAPELPATILANFCYSNMFNNCTALSIAPELPAATLAEWCYNSMFEGCNKLNYIKMLATDISASGCLQYWVYKVSSTGTFIKHPDMTSLPTGISGIPEGWTVEDAA